MEYESPARWQKKIAGGKHRVADAALAKSRADHVLVGKAVPPATSIP